MIATVSDSANVQRIRDKGIEVFIGHSAANLGAAEVLVVSTAIKQDNPELVAAREKLLPVVTQDVTTKEVLILSFVNKQAYNETRNSGYATYWSRSRNELWKKGLTSGDMLRIEEIRINCEQNSFLFLGTMMLRWVRGENPQTI